MSDSYLVSVVIGIRDWEPQRLELAIRSHLECSISSDIEIIVSDYGSSDPDPVKAICTKFNCVYQYTEADIWSRSRALNIGLSMAKSDMMVTTDADIIFAPRTLEGTLKSLENNPNSIVLAQCSDLSEAFTLEKAANFPWDDIYRDAVLRPRWGMGGLCAFNRTTLDEVRGFEERMVVWGSEDNDFVKRCRQAGRYMHWISGQDVGIYHVWHPPFLEVNPKSNDIHEVNKVILKNDLTTARNYLGPTCYVPRKPLVSINIASYNRGHLIGDVIQSLLNQSVQDFEILIYDDGSSDNTNEVVASFKDSRIRFFPNTRNVGVAAARNSLLRESIGQYICIHDDDDIMLPNRLELQLNAMTSKYVGNYGGWVDYDSVTGELSRQPGKEPFGMPTVAFTGSALAHGTLMIKTDVLKRIGYETSFRGGSDYNLAFRLAASGYKLNHCGDYVILRRVHKDSLTGQSSDKQKLSSRITIAPFLNNISNHVEAHLRKVSRDVKAVKISPIYSDSDLVNFMPDDLFDHAYEVMSFSNTNEQASIISFCKNSDLRRFVLWSRRGDGVEFPESLLEKRRFRVRKPVLNTDGLACLEEYLPAIAQAVQESTSDNHTNENSILECADFSEEDIQEAFDFHAHLVNSLAFVRYQEANFIVVNAITRETARFTTHSILRILTAKKRIKNSSATITQLIPLDNEMVQELSA